MVQKSWLRQTFHIWPWSVNLTFDQATWNCTPFHVGEQLCQVIKNSHNYWRRYRLTICFRQIYLFIYINLTSRVTLTSDIAIQTFAIPSFKSFCLKMSYIMLWTKLPHIYHVSDAIIHPNIDNMKRIIFLEHIFVKTGTYLCLKFGNNFVIFHVSSLRVPETVLWFM